MDSMTTILFTDTHFGIKQNSLTWLNSQLDFIKNQLIPTCKKYNDVRLIHLGDVFDSRSTISTYIAAKVIDVFKELCDVVNEFIIVGGNHDYYSPNSDIVNTVDLMMGHLNINIVSKDYLIISDELFVPWYIWQDHMNGIIDLQKIIDENKIKRIYTHADIVYNYSKINVDIFSGHNHIPYIKNHLYNLGSCYALDFADSNSERGFYIIENDELKFHPNEYSIRFWRLKEKDILKYNELGIKPNDYVEIYVNQMNMSLKMYSDVINKITKDVKHVWIIPQVENIIDKDNAEKFECYNIEAIAEDMIPEDLKEKFNLILQSMNK